MTATHSVFNRGAFVLLWLFVFTMPWEKAVVLPHLGSLGRLAGMLAVGGCLFALLFEGRLRLPARVHLVAASFVLWSALTYCWSIQSGLTQEKVVTLTQLLLSMFLFWQFCGLEARVHLLLNAYVLGTLVPSLDTVRRFLSGTQSYYQRYSTAGFDPNDLALTLALSLPLSYYLWLTGSGWRRWVYPVQMLIVLGVILLTASRGGTLAALLGLSLVPLTFRRLSRRHRAAQLVLAILAVAGASLVTPASTWKRLATFGSEVSEGTLNSRTLLWQGGWRAFGDVAFQGVGSGAYPESLASTFGRPRGFVPVAHNTFLSVLVETGVIGFSLFAALLLLLATAALRMQGPARLLWLVMLAVWSLGVMSLTWEQCKPTWLLFSLLAAHSRAYASAPPRRQPAFAPVWKEALAP